MNRVQMYHEVGGYSEALGATPAQLISLLFNKLELDLEAAKSALKEGDIIKKCDRVAHAGTVLEYLRDCLDFEAAPDVSAVLDDYYARLGRLMFKANAENNMASILDCLTVVKNIKDWWETVL